MRKLSNEQIKIQRGFIQIPLLIGIIITLAIIISVGVGGVLYWQGKLPQLVTKTPTIESLEQATTSRTLSEETQKRITELEQRIKELEGKQEVTSQEQSSPPLRSEEQETTNNLRTKLNSLQERLSQLENQFILTQKTETLDFQDLKTTQGLLEQIDELLKEAEELGGANKGIELAALEIFERVEESITKLSKIVSPEGYPTVDIVKKMGKYIVRVICVDYYGYSKWGSGILYAKLATGQSMILTNRHLTKDAYWNPDGKSLKDQYPCYVGYSSDPTKEITDLYLALPVSWSSKIPESTMELIDFSFLRIDKKVTFSGDYLTEIPNASLSITDSFPAVCDTAKIEVGKEVVVLGYPSIGGENITVTEGIISGFDGSYYLTTSAKIEQGSSGGGAFLRSPLCLAGMPTFARLGKIESLARLINLPYLEKNYISKIFDY